MTASIFAAHRLGRTDRLATRSIQRSFVLVSLAWPELHLAQWHEMVRYYRCRPPSRAGLVLIEDGRGYVYAVFRYIVDIAPSLHMPQRGGVLRVHDLIMADLSGRAVTSAIQLGLAELAHACRCQTVDIETVSRQSGGPWSDTRVGLSLS
jgi:hypothetical protein